VKEIMQSEIYTGWFSSHLTCSPIGAEETGLAGEINQVIGARNLLFGSSILKSRKFHCAHSTSLLRE